MASKTLLGHKEGLLYLYQISGNVLHGHRGLEKMHQAYRIVYRRMGVSSAWVPFLIDRYFSPLYNFLVAEIYFR